MAKNQFVHFVIFLLLGVILWVLPIEGSRLWYGFSAKQLVFISWIFAALFQGWVAFWWRVEFHKKLMTRLFGGWGFPIFKLGFVIFALTRFLLLGPISYTTVGSINLPLWLIAILIFLPLPLILWGVYSTVFYFGVNRVFGADHFDERYRGGSLELRGTFKYIPNSMYTVILLLIYHPGLIWNSWEGLVVALIHHTFVWAHYYCTEKPDMKLIYGS